MSDNTNNTPSDTDNKLGLTNPDEINIQEAKGIAKAEQAIFELEEIIELSVSLILEIHSVAFGHMYEWAGKWRTGDVTVGNFIPPAPAQIPFLMYQFVDEVNYKVQQAKTKEDLIHLLSYCHHRFVHIHPFTNGNGRSARLLTNYYALSFGYKELNIYHRTGDKRQIYIEAIRHADKGNFESLEKIISEELELIAT